MSLLTSADLQSCRGERHLHKTGIGVLTMLRQDLFDTGCRLRILGDHIEVSASTRPWQLIAETQVVNQIRQGSDGLGIRPTVELLVLQPGLPHQCSHPLEVVTLDGVIHLHRVFLHLPEQTQFGAVIQEHAAHDLCQDMFRRTGDTCIIQQMTRPVLGL